MTQPLLEVLPDAGGSNRMADSSIIAIEDAALLERELPGLAGVVETGLLTGLAARVIVAGACGVEGLEQ